MLLYHLMVLPTRIELVFYPYQGYVIPLYYESILGCLTGIDPVPTVSQTAMQATTL